MGPRKMSMPLRRGFRNNNRLIQYTCMPKKRHKWFLQRQSALHAEKISSGRAGHGSSSRQACSKEVCLLHDAQELFFSHTLAKLLRDALEVLERDFARLVIVEETEG